MTLSHFQRRTGRNTVTTVILLLTLCAATLRAQGSKNESETYPFALPTLSLSAGGEDEPISSNLITRFAFDPSQDLLWMAARRGVLTSHVQLEEPRFRRFSLPEENAQQRFNLAGIQTLSVRGSRVWMSASRISERDAAVRAGDGLLFSEDSRVWRRLSQPLDQAIDTVERYGNTLLRALPIIVAEQNIIYDIAVGQASQTAWIATWSGGIRRTRNNGQTWQRMVLPPDGQSRLNPSDSITTPLEPRRGNSGQYTYLGFSVLQAENGEVWVGTVDGLCRTTTADSLYPSWEKFRRQNTERPNGGITGNWVIAIREQAPTATRSGAIWAATWQGPSNQERFGVSWTRDNGQTWSNGLLGERIYDIAFKGDTVFAVGSSGIFTSYNSGETWIQQRGIRDATLRDKAIKPTAECYAVIVIPPIGSIPSRVWIGTSDGTAISDNGGASWSILRAETPQPTSASVFAYPNPFSPRLDRQTRIRYSLSAPSSVTVSLYDFSMKPVRTLFPSSALSPGAYEVSWDGRAESGARLANGVYFYRVSAGNKELGRGKILIVD